jgi:hypothetical protein
VIGGGGERVVGVGAMYWLSMVYVLMINTYTPKIFFQIVTHQFRDTSQQTPQHKLVQHTHRGLENLCLSCNKIIIVPTKCRKCDESLVCSVCITCGKCKQEIAEAAQRREASRDALQASQE